MRLSVRRALDRVFSGAGSRGQRRNWVILFDTATTALTGVVLLIGAARSLGAEALSTFSIAQLIVVTAAGILRAAVFGPALAAQRTTGRASIPARWSVTIAPPAAIILTALIGLLGGGSEGLLWLPSVAVAASVYLVQDALRNVLWSRNKASAVLTADVVACVLVLATAAIHRMPTSPPALMLFWGAAGVPGLAYTIVVASRGKRTTERLQTLAETWRLGRWGAMDAALAAVALLLPMVVSTLVLSTTASGTYRVLLTALGPLNILHSTVLTVLMLDSWQTSTRAGLTALRRKVLGILLVMVIGTLLYVAAAMPTMVALSGLDGPDASRVALVIGLTGVLGSATTPFNAAALTLGRQHWGVGIRLVTVAIAVAVSVGSSAWVPWQDPIGVSMLGGGIVVLVGWAMAYTVADRRETAALHGPPPATDIAPALRDGPR